MKKIFIVITGLFIYAGILFAQNDTVYIMKAGVVLQQHSIKSADVDSIIFYKPVNPCGIIQTSLIPAGMFIMGSPTSEVGRQTDETQFAVSPSAFRMSKYVITNAQYAAFLNAKSIGKNGLYAAGAFPTQSLIIASTGGTDFGLHYNDSQWVPVVGYENNPVIYETWYGATVFASY